MQKSRKPIEIKISTVVAVSAFLNETDPALLDKALKEMTGGTPDFFEDEFAVIDLANIEGTAADIDWTRLVALFKQYRLNLVAVRNAAPESHAQIVAHGLSIDSMVRPQEPAAPVAEVAPAPVAPAPVATPVPQAAPITETVFVDTPIRAGQRIYARGADLVIMAAVNNGAEVIADGSIHIYAPLRGRALAGASGNTNARIFTTSLEAELVSIAGVYKTFENALPAELLQQQVQIRLDGERINMTRLQSAK